MSKAEESGSVAVAATTEAYYDSEAADSFYAEIWGGEDIHIGVYQSPDEDIATASARTVETVAEQLDFLTQEFNREAYTICSKSNDIAITQAGLAMKAAIEQMREQVQNIE